ncbi:MAG: SDR family oxidoreductase [Acidobacteria bacterium]|nr:SDR family oxidoreductase [Acidobacteriota bacterium]
MEKLANKVAVITGGNSGIGLAIAKQFRAEGARIAIFGRDEKPLKLASEELGSGTVVIQGDVTRLADLDRLYRETTERLGKIDILVANAGIATFTPIDNTTETQFDQISDINFKGAFFTVQKAVAHLNPGASILLVTSAANTLGRQSLSIYAATKAAVRSLARSFSADLLPRGVRVNALSPGPILTPIFDRLGMPKEQLEEVAQTFVEQNPMKRFGTAEEMAQAALFLASPASSYVAGAELVADGGFSQL